tara:strand:- start:3859 stop:4731 length:873 start_codon:yes stop_codon:yes gene_type:complete
MFKPLFIPTFPRTWPSARMRFWQLCDAWEEADCYLWNNELPSNFDEYDLFVFGKDINKEIIDAVKLLKSKGKIVCYDVCDPYWWWNKLYYNSVKLFDKVIVSGRGLKDDIDKTFDIDSIFIPDRMPYIDEVKVHESTDVVRLAWFGMSENRSMCLHPVGVIFRRLLLHGLSFKLVIIDDEPDTKYVNEDWMEHRRWSLARVNDDLLSCDIAFLPDYAGPRGNVKSDNKIALAGWLGLPCHNGMDYHSLSRLMVDDRFRAEEGKKARKYSEENFDINLSVKEWKALIGEIS